MLFRRLQRFGYLQCCITVAELVNKSDITICFALTHALNHLLPPSSLGRVTV